MLRKGRAKVLGAFPHVAQNVCRMRGVFQLKPGSHRDSVVFGFLQMGGCGWCDSVCVSP